MWCNFQVDLEIICLSRNRIRVNLCLQVFVYQRSLSVHGSQKISADLCRQADGFAVRTSLYSICLAVWHCRRPTSATTISPERSCASGYWNPAHRPHYAGSPVSSLAAGATTRHFQVGDTGSQVLERPEICRRRTACLEQPSSCHP